ncbi:hypothetical protein B7494_g4624 [Chlorociboria aeruginascens]|nr:hypothetical protein B7494_g4624 [Chlorociboria aeruginascens]
MSFNNKNPTPVQATPIIVPVDRATMNADKYTDKDPERLKLKDPELLAKYPDDQAIQDDLATEEQRLNMLKPVFPKFVHYNTIEEIIEDFDEQDQAYLKLRILHPELAYLDRDGFRLHLEDQERQAKKQLQEIILKYPACTGRSQEELNSIGND